MIQERTSLQRHQRRNVIWNIFAPCKLTFFIIPPELWKVNTYYQFFIFYVPCISHLSFFTKYPSTILIGKTPIIVATQIIFPFALVCVTAFQKNIILRIKTKTGWHATAFLFYNSFRWKPAQNKKKYIAPSRLFHRTTASFFQTYGIVLRFFLKFSKDLCNTSPQERTICEKISGKWISARILQYFDSGKIRIFSFTKHKILYISTISFTICCCFATYFQILFIFPSIIKPHVIITFFCAKAAVFNRFSRTTPVENIIPLIPVQLFLVISLQNFRHQPCVHFIVTFRRLAFPYFDSCHIQKNVWPWFFSKRNGGWNPSCRRSNLHCQTHIWEDMFLCPPSIFKQIDLCCLPARLWLSQKFIYGIAHLFWYTKRNDMGA